MRWPDAAAAHLHRRISMSLRITERRRGLVRGFDPHAITLDGYAASHRAVREMKANGRLPEDKKVRSSKYLNNRA